MCPVIVDDGLYAFITPGPKRNDLVRDGRYVMHCFSPVNNEDAFSVRGRAERCTDDTVVARVDDVFWKERKIDSTPPEAKDQQLFEFFIESCLLTRTTGIGDWNPQHTIWKAD